MKPLISISSSKKTNTSNTISLNYKRCSSKEDTYCLKNLPNIFKMNLLIKKWKEQLRSSTTMYKILHLNYYHLNTKAFTKPQLILYHQKQNLILIRNLKSIKMSWISAIWVKPLLELVNRLYLLEEMFRTKTTSINSMNNTLCQRSRHPIIWNLISSAKWNIKLYWWRDVIWEHGGLLKKSQQNLYQDLFNL